MKIRIFLPTLLALLGSLSQPLSAMYMPVEIRNIPIRRLIENLSEKAKADPSNPETLHQLARVHAIAYSSKLDDAALVEVTEKTPDKPWFGNSPPHVPHRQITETTEEPKLEAAKAHLAAAIANYKMALAAKPGDATILLGLAWCQDQAGEKQAAIAGYRKVAAAAWEEESTSTGGLGNFRYVETADYLIPLLDKDKDAAEIKELTARKETLLALPRMVTPIIVPVGDDAVNLDALVDQNARVRFDLDGTGRQLEWPWITTNAAWLVFDPQQTGKITSSVQMFGSRSFLLFCADGYEALSLLDDDADSSISGFELSGLALWRDLNSNGVSDPGEVKPVFEYGISSLSTKCQTHPSGIPYSAEGVTLTNGGSHPTYDLILKSAATAR